MKTKIEIRDNIDAYYSQIVALLDLIQSSDANVDHGSVITAAEMCVTMLDELMTEVNMLKEAMIKCKQVDHSDDLILATRPVARNARRRTSAR